MPIEEVLVNLRASEATFSVGVPGNPTPFVTGFDVARDREVLIVHDEALQALVDSRKSIREVVNTSEV